MIKLSIKKPGQYLKLPGMADLRTPVDIDISGKDLVLIIAELRRQSITDFTIQSHDNIPQKKKKQKNKPTKIIKEPESNVDNRLNMIESLLKKLINKPNVIEKTKEIITKVVDHKDKIIDEDDDNEIFIPTVNTDHLKADPISIEERTIDDVSDAADALHKLNKK
jgi:hypothetical protein